MADGATKAGQIKPKSLVQGILLAIVLGLAVNIIIGLFMDHESVISNLSNISLVLIVIPFGTQMGAVLIDVVRTKLVCHGLGHKISWKTAFMNSSLGWFFNLVTPMAAGGQPFQVYHLTQNGVPSKSSANVILSRFVVNSFLMILMIGGAIPVLNSIEDLFPSTAIVFYAGLGVTILFSVFFLLILVNPMIIGRFALRSRHNRFGKFIARVSKKPKWSLELLQWSHKLRRDVLFMWSKRLGYMLVDVILNLGVILVQGLGLYLVLTAITGANITFWQVMISYIVIWQVIFYLPTPGASGGLEGAFTLVFSGFTGMAEKTLISIFTWRLGSYYLIILFGLIVFLAYMGGRKREAAKLQSGV